MSTRKVLATYGEDQFCGQNCFDKDTTCNRSVRRKSCANIELGWEENLHEPRSEDGTAYLGRKQETRPENGDGLCQGHSQRHLFIVSTDICKSLKHPTAGLNSPPDILKNIHTFTINEKPNDNAIYDNTCGLNPVSEFVVVLCAF